MSNRIHLSLLLLPLLGLIAGAAHSQGQKPYPVGTPIDKVTADPVQGGALSEYHEGTGNASNPSRATIGSTPRRYGDDNAYRQRRQAGTHTNGIDTSDLPPPGPIQELVVQSEQGVRWLCGGIGKREVTYMKKMAEDFDLMLTFVTADGAYLADVDVRIVDDKDREVLQTRCAAPILLVDLPEDGNYRIYADLGSHTLNRKLRIPQPQGASRSLIMTLPSPVSATR